jgi:hypothetical protein
MSKVAGAWSWPRAEFKGGRPGAVAPGPPQNGDLHKIQKNPSFFFYGKKHPVNHHRKLAWSGRVGVSSSVGCRASRGVCIYVFLVILRNKNKKKRIVKTDFPNIFFIFLNYCFINLIQPKFVVTDRGLHILIVPWPPTTVNLALSWQHLHLEQSRMYGTLSPCLHVMVLGHVYNFIFTTIGTSSLNWGIDYKLL